MPNRFLFLSLLILLCSSELFTQEKWTPKDIVYTQYVGSPQFSPDGELVVWSKSRAIKEKDRFTGDLFLTHLGIEEKGKPLTVQLTQSDENDYGALFSRDSKKVYFQSGREKGKKLWAISRYGGEAEAVHTFENSFRNLQWLNDHTLAMLSNEGPTRMEREWKKKKDDTQVIEDTVYWTRTQVYSFDLQGKELKRLTDFNYPVSYFQLSHNGRWMITRQQMSPHYPSDAQPKPRYVLHDLENGTQSPILEGLQTPGSFQFTMDDSGFYFQAELSSDPEWNGSGINELYYFNLTTNAFTKVDLKWEWGTGGGMFVMGNDVLVSLAKGPVRRIAFYQRQNDSVWTKSDPDFETMDEHVAIQAISEDGKQFLFNHSTASQLPVYYHAKWNRSNGKISPEENKEWISLNGKLKKKEKARSEVIRWKGALGDEVTGILYYPNDYVEGERYPLLLSIHGGPSGVDLDSWRERWSTYPNLWTQRGAFVLKPNYHGSSSHGLEFVESIKGHYYDLELEDIMTGIRTLSTQGLVDTTQMGAMGWSNGAILATMLTVRYPDHFKVATPGAGDVNWTSDFGTCRFGVSFDQSYFGGAPWDDVDGQFFNPVYLEKSPLFEIEKVKTPTLIFHGSNDRAVPRDQGWEYYRGLQQVGKAPVRFLWFPNQPHGLRKISHQLRKMEEEIAWIETYLFEKPSTLNPAFDEQSPLAMLLKREKLSYSNGLAGDIVDSKLVPQVALVKDDSISIGVFEVTNAQFAAFMPEHTYPSNEANKPVRGLNGEAVLAYLNALNTHTGRTYRIPSQEEAKALHKLAMKVAEKENTIPYWAGYQPTSRELGLLKDKLEELNGDLIMEVGRFAPVKAGKAELYDLGGNVAERAAGDSVYGFSAYQAKNVPGEKATGVQLGFRVVKD